MKISHDYILVSIVLLINYNPFLLIKTRSNSLCDYACHQLFQLYANVTLFLNFMACEICGAYIVSYSCNSDVICFVTKVFTGYDNW